MVSNFAMQKKDFVKKSIQNTIFYEQKIFLVYYGGSEFAAFSEKEQAEQFLKKYPTFIKVIGRPNQSPIFSLEKTYIEEIFLNPSF